MSTNMEILSASYGTLLGTNADASDYISKCRNVWMNSFLFLFKKLLAEHPDTIDTDYVSDFNTDEYYKTCLEPIIDAVNDYKNDFLKSALVQDQDAENDLDDDVDYFDFDDDLSVTRITNPTITDLCPDIKISEVAYMEQVVSQFTESTGIEFPYNDLPIMTMFPSISGVYNFGKMYVSVIDSGENKKRHTYYAILEVSRTSIMRDLAALQGEYNRETKELSDAGGNILRGIIEKYTDFAVPIICINLRRDYHQYTNFISNLYNSFSNNYTSAVRLQRDMYLIFREVISSPIGVNLAFLYSSQYATSTLEFLHSSYKYGALLTELDNVLNETKLTNYIPYIREYTSIYKDLAQMFDIERESFINIVTTNTNRMFDYIVTYFNTNGGNDKLGNLKTLVNGAFSSMLNEISTTKKFNKSLLADTVAAFVDSLNFNNIDNILANISRKAGLAYVNTTPGIHSNRAALNPGRPNDADFLARQTTFIGHSSAAAESTTLITEVLISKKSNAVMRSLATRFENVNSFEDAMGLLIDSKAYYQICDQSTAHENAETQQFKVFLGNCVRKAENMKDEYSVKDM